MGQEALPLVGQLLSEKSEAAAQRNAGFRARANQPTPGRQLLGLGGGQAFQGAQLQQPDLAAIFKLIQSLQGGGSTAPNAGATGFTDLL